MRNIHNFETQSLFNDYFYSNSYIEPSVSLIGDVVKYNAYEDELTERLKYIPLTFEILTDGVVSWKMSNTSAVTKTIQYKLNQGAWTSISSSTTGANISVSSGDILQFRGDNSAYATSSASSYNKFYSTAEFNVKGNIMSLINSTNFSTLTSLSKYAFRGIFAGNSNLKNADKLKLPATTLAINCYSFMFQDCTNLITAPELPAMNLTQYCYSQMFYRCLNLTAAPSLPATNLADCCYYNMFESCRSLMTAPELPATTLASSCYDSMFTSCTGLTRAPELPATTLAGTCYQNMFKNCSNLNYIKALFTTSPSSTYNYTKDWVSGVAATGTFVKNAAAAWNVTGVNGVPSGWTVKTATA